MGNSNKSPQKNQSNSGVNSPSSSKICLTLKCFTWEKESHGLFDYESKTTIKNTYTIIEPGKVLREKNEIKFIKQNISYEPGPDHKFLFDFENRGGDHCITSQTFDSKDMKKIDTEGLGETAIWFVVKSLKVNQVNKGFKLNIGDYFKLGRMRFRIKELKTGPDHEKKKSSEPKEDNVTEIDEKTSKPNHNNSFSSPPSKSELKTVVCRICLSDDNEPDNPLTTPCKCAGTMKFIHIKCLQKWLKSKLQVKKTPIYMSMIIKPLLCELCQSPFPENIEHSGKKYESLEIPKPENHYMVVEILSRDKNICKGLHIINMGVKNQIKLGRGHEVDIRINDISVSRFHALLKLEKGEFFIEDNNSKFGTLVLIKEPLALNTSSSFALQIGRTVFSVSVKKKKKVRNTCFGISAKKETIDNKNNKNKSKDDIKIGNIENEEIANPDDLQHEDNEAIVNDAIELDNVIFNNDAIPNHIDIIDFNDGDEENMEPEVIFGNENLNNMDQEHEENQINSLANHFPLMSSRDESNVINQRNVQN